MADLFIFPRRLRWPRFLGLALGWALATACDDKAVVWVDEAPIVSAAPSPLAHPPYVPMDSGLRADSPEAEFLLVQDLMREAGAATLLSQTLMDMPEANEAVAMGEMLPMLPMAMAPLTPMGDGDEPLDTARCARSLRMALAPRRGRVAVWWSRRENSKVWLQAAWRDTMPAEGRLGAWRGPIVVDSVDQGPGDAQAADRGAAGCDRPPPSVVVDDTHGYVHVAYVLVGPEGPGVFYAHQMDPRATFELPAVIMYGDRLGTVRVAASGNLVAVVYEDPNSGARPRVGLAVSNTSGHTFEDRLTASGSSSIAHDPYVVVRGRAIVQGWSELPPAGGEPTFRIRRALARK
jgi:hypothetical protein